MTIKQFYEYCKTNLELVIGVQEVRMFNNDLTNLEEIDIIHTPTVLIEFQQIDYSREVQSQVSGNTFVVLHVIQETVLNNDPDLLDLPEAIKAHFNTLRMVYIVGQNVDHNHRNLIDHQIIIETNQIDLYDFETLMADVIPVINGNVASDLTCSNLLAGITENQKNICILPTYDFSDNNVFNSLTGQQIAQLEQRFMLDIQPQNTTQLGNVSGVLTIDYNNNSWQEMTLTGNINSVILINFPSYVKSVNLELLVIQDSTGGHAINFNGSGVEPFEGVDLQPQSGANSKTRYTFIWNGTTLQVGKTNISPAI